LGVSLRGCGVAAGGVPLGVPLSVPLDVPLGVPLNVPPEVEDETRTLRLRRRRRGIIIERFLTLDRPRGIIEVLRRITVSILEDGVQSESVSRCVRNSSLSSSLLSSFPSPLSCKVPLFHSTIRPKKDRTNLTFCEIHQWNTLNTLDHDISSVYLFVIGARNIRKRESILHIEALIPSQLVEHSAQNNFAFYYNKSTELEEIFIVLLIYDTSYRNEVIIYLFSSNYNESIELGGGVEFFLYSSAYNKSIELKSVFKEHDRLKSLLLNASGSGDNIISYTSLIYFGFNSGLELYRVYRVGRRIKDPTEGGIIPRLLVLVFKAGGRSQARGVGCNVGDYSS
jgi:hypothetical protein